MKNIYQDIYYKLLNIDNNPLQLDSFVEKFILRQLKDYELSSCLDFLHQQYLITENKSMQYKLDYVTNLLNFFDRNNLSN